MIHFDLGIYKILQNRLIQLDVNGFNHILNKSEFIIM